jgi:tetratricopeptide (TPR) repeat protein
MSSSSDIDPNALLQEAQTVRQAGDIPRAAALYRQLLQHFPDQPRLLQLLGTAELTLGHNEESVALFSRLLMADPDQPAAYSNRGVALQKLGRLDDALTDFDTALALQPDHADALNNRGGVLNQMGRHDEALASLDRLLALTPGAARAHNNRGNALRQLGRPAEALAAYDRAIALDAGFVEAHNNRGAVLLKLQRPEEALAAFDRAIALRPNHAKAHNNRGNALQALQRHNEALTAYTAAIDLDSTYAEAYNNLGNLLHFAVTRSVGDDEDDIRRRFTAALDCFDRAIALKPDYAAAYANRSNVLRGLGRYDEALADCDRAVALAPEQAEAHNNRGGVLRGMLRLDEAQACFDRAIARDPECAEAYWNLALVKLMSGDLAAGLPLYEWRWRATMLKDYVRSFARPLWLGDAPLDGKTLLIHAEQGFGDAIQFCRYAPIAAARGAHVVIETQKALLPLLATLKGDFVFVETGRELPDFDYHCPIMSLPLAFKTTLDTIPGETPYLFADPEKRLAWRKKLGDKKARRIGLAWSGQPGLLSDRNRSLPLGALAPLLDKPYEFHALQKDIRPRDAETLKDFPQLALHRDELNDFADTAALTAEMDLVISVDTVIAHLAGSMAKPVWILLPQMGEWRWLLNRSDSPWYASARLFRPQAGDWNGLVAEICGQLQTS